MRKRAKTTWMKKGWVLAAVLLLGIGVLAACGDGGGDQGNGEGQADGGFLTLSAEEAYDRMNENEDAVILDVRTQEEFEESHIPGAILVPNESIGEEPPEQLPDKDAEILVYCRSGNRSRQAAQKLADLGYTNVADFGGISDWPYDTVSGPADETAQPASGAGGGADQASGGANQAGGAADQAGGGDGAGSEDPSFANFTAEDIDGNSVDQSVWADADLTMVNIWGTFCGPCIREMPDLGELNKEYADQNVQIVGIVTDVINSDLSVSAEMVETAKEIIDKTGADYLHLVPSEDLLYAGVGSVRSIPFTFFLDKDGNLVGNTYKGSRSKEKWESIIDSTLKEVLDAAQSR